MEYGIIIIQRYRVENINSIIYCYCGLSHGCCHWLYKFCEFLNLSVKENNVEYSACIDVIDIWSYIYIDLIFLVRYCPPEGTASLALLV